MAIQNTYIFKVQKLMKKKNANENATWNIRSVGLKVPRGIEVIGFKHYLLSKALKGLPHY